MTWKAKWTSVAFALSAAVTVMAVGCQRDGQSSTLEPSAEPRTAPAAPTEGAAALAQGAGAAGETAGAARIEEESFVLAMQPKGPYAAGKPGAVELVLEARGGYKCNDKYPYKFKVQDAEGVDFASKVVSSENVKLEKERATMTVAFTPQSAGKKTIAGQFAFSVCTEERCLVERRDLALQIDVP